MRVYSGSCCMCECGVQTGISDWYDNPLFTGDIVQLYHGNYIGTDIEEWMPAGLSVVVSDQYTSYASGKIEETGGSKFFTMGIATVGVWGDAWKVRLVKSHTLIVPGERIAEFGFNWREVEALRHE